MSKPSPFDDLQLNSVVYEAAPWEGLVHRRYVNLVQTHGSVAHQGGTVTTKRFLFVSGSYLDSPESQLKENEWGVRFFTDLELARRVCAERAVALKAERRQQLESEMAALAKQLEQA